MQAKFSSSQGYQEFDELACRVEGGPTVASATLPGYERASVARRLVQRVVELMSDAYVSAAARRQEAGGDPLCRQAVVQCGGLRLTIATGRIVPTPRLFARAFGEFAIHWLHVCYVYLAAAVRRGAGTGPATLLFGVGMGDLGRGGNDARFVQYCRGGPLLPLVHARRIIAQATVEIAATDAAFIGYARFPLHAQVTQNPPGIRALARFLKRHFLALGWYAVALWRCPAMALLGRDLAYHAMATDLNDRGLLQAVVITNSNFSAQPLWMTALPARTYETHMVWYSTNSLPIMWSGERAQVNLPTSRHIRADASWVWNDWQGKMLRSFGFDGPVHVVGPILWYLRGAAPVVRHEEFRVAAFDVTPVTDALAHELGLVDNYYSTEIMSAFVEDIVHVCRAIQDATGVPTKVLVKHKRGHLTIHDRRYIEALDGLAARQSIQLVAPDTDMFAFILGCDISIAIPYSSPVYVAEHLQRPAIYYDPTGKVWPNYGAGGTVKFAAGRKQLFEQLRQITGGNGHRQGAAGAAQGN